VQSFFMAFFGEEIPAAPIDAERPAGVEVFRKVPAKETTRVKHSG